MRIQRIPLFLIGLMLAVSATAQKEKDRGYWALTYKKTLLDGERFNGNNTGIENGMNGKAVFKILEYMPSTFKADGTYSVRHEPGMVIITEGGQRTPEKRTIRSIETMWTKPPQYVKVGEENKIEIKVKTTLDGQPFDIDQLWGDLKKAAKKYNFVNKFERSHTVDLDIIVTPEVTVGNTTLGYDMMQSILANSTNEDDLETYSKRYVANADNPEAVQEALEKQYEERGGIMTWGSCLRDKAEGRLYCTDDWSQQLVLGKESYMVVSVKAAYSTDNGIAPNGATKMLSYAVTQFYLYKYYPNGGDIENTVRADDDDQWLGGGDNEEGGEDGGTILPPWMIPVGVGTIGTFVGYKLIKRRRKGDEDGPDEPEDELEKEPEEEPEEEDEPKKPSTYKMILYKNFGSKLVVGDEPKIVGARIEERTAEGKRIERHDLTKQIEIEQGENLRIVETGLKDKYKVASITADDYPEESHEGDIWFIFRTPNGALRNKVVFNIEMSEIIFGQDNLTLPSGYEKEVRLPFVAVGLDRSEDIVAQISPADGNPDLANTYSVNVEWDEETHMHFAVIHDLKPAGKLAGRYERHLLEIEAPSKSGKSIKGSLDIRRFHMGLAVHVGDIGCYIEEYSARKHATRRFAFAGAEGKTYTPAETHSSIVLYEYDESEHKVLQLAPVLTGCKWKAFDDEKQKLVDKLGLQCNQTGEKGDKGGSEAIFRCCRCALDAPQRIEVILTLTTKHLDREYSTDTKVLLCSQPVRHFGSLNEEMAVLKEEEHTTERLLHIQRAIFEQGLYEKLFPLEKFIEVMLEGYKPEYGYDPDQVKRVRDLYTGVLSGTIEGAGGKAAKDMTLAEEVGLFLEVFIARSKEIEDSMGFFTRLVVGVATMGCADVVFTGLEIVRDMKEYVDNGGDSVWEGFIVGAKVAAREFVMDQAGGYAMEKMSKIAKNAGLTPEAIKKGAMEMVDEGKGFLNTIKGKVMKNALNDSTEASKRAISKSKMIKEMAKSKPLTKAEKELLEISEFGFEHAKEQVRDLQAAVDLYRMNPHGPGNKEMLNKLILDVQQNKQAMYLLNNADESLNYVRSKFNTTLETIYEETDSAVKKKLSQGTGIPEHMIEKLNATTSDKMKLIKGQKVTMDRDVTYFWKDANGDIHYFSQKNTTELYNKEFYQKSLGYKASDSKFANRWAGKMDQTNIEDVLHHAESYGKDLDNMLKPELHKQALLDPTKVGDTVTYKGKEWFGKGEALLENAKGITDLTERQLMQSQGVSSIMEGIRQEVKQFDNFVNPRNIARLQANGASRIPDNLRAAVECCRRINKMESADALLQIERELSLLGFTRDSFAEAMGQAIKDIG